MAPKINPRAGKVMLPDDSGTGQRPADKRKWFPMSWALSNHDWSEYIKKTWPQVYVNGDAVKNNPTKADPLGARSSLVFDFNSDDFKFRICLFEEWSPWLTPDAVEAYLYVQWPEYFRRGSNGQAPE